MSGPNYAGERGEPGPSGFQAAEIERLKVLLARAADALEETRKFDFISREVLDANGITEDLIAELRKAAE